MFYYLENEHLKAKFTDKGAELKSLCSKKDGFEYIWPGDSRYWEDSAIILFPICGRLQDKKYTFMGKEYHMDLHGFAKKSIFSVAEHTSDKIVFELHDSDETRAEYPFGFVLKLTYTLKDNSLETKFTVINTGKDDLLFSVGGHPGFNVPLENGLDFTDHYLEFDKAEKRTKILLADSGLYLGKDEYVPLENDKILRLNHSLFSQDAIFFSAKDGSLTLKSDKSTRWVKVSYSDVTHLGVWQTYADDTPFICIEPWHGIPGFEGKVDDFADKNEMIHLKDGKSYIFSFDITVSF